jgi:hypothetical protein
MRLVTGDWWNVFFQPQLQPQLQLQNTQNVTGISQYMPLPNCGQFEVEVEVEVAVEILTPGS